MEIHGEGPLEARVMVVGEAPGADEERLGRPFVGTSGLELDKMLAEGGLHRSTCFVTNVSRQRPPNNKMELWLARKPSATCSVAMRERFVHPAVADGMAALLRELALVRPTLILALGNLSMWALTGKWGITDWRGSELMVDWMGEPTKVIPTYHPAAVLRQWSWRSAVVRDIQRAHANLGSRTYADPQWKFELRPSFQQVMERLAWLRMLAEAGSLPLTFDLETRASHIACAGLAWSARDSLCIPFMAAEADEGYWSLEQETEILWALRDLFTHENVRVVGQNLLYDAQYTWRHWHWVPRVTQDTMISHHTAFCEQPKALDYQASLYCSTYRFWKHDAKEWAKGMGEDILWRYNCEDCVRTWEVAEETAAAVRRLGLEEVDAFQQSMFWPVLRAMTRGVRIDTEMRDRLNKELKDGIKEREKWVEEVLGHRLNPRSPKQMQALFYSDFAQRPILKRRGDGKYTPTLDDDALTKIAMREPLLRPLVGTMLDTRTLGTLRSTFIQAPLDTDGRMRCSYNLCGTVTYRLSSSENAFGSGANLQNLPSDESRVNTKVEKRGTGLTIPNIRAMFIPDEGHTFFDVDLSKADLRVVVWESDEREMKAMLAEGRDPYVETAREFYRKPGITKEDREYGVFKAFAHGSHYLATPKGLSESLGLPVHQIEQTQKWYFGKYPRIFEWQARFIEEVQRTRRVRNAFGYTRFVFERIPQEKPRKIGVAVSPIVKELIAWLPQSTIGILINRIWKRIYDEAPSIEVLLQGHDSLAGQFPTTDTQAPERIRNLARIPIPYPDPLIIPANPKTSTVSWGSCG